MRLNVYIVFHFIKMKAQQFPSFTELSTNLLEDFSTVECRSGLLHSVDLPDGPDYFCRRGGMGSGMLKVVAATPMPPSQVLGGTVPV